jgi:uncharacterized RDD family membrane protein YckC
MKCPKCNYLGFETSDRCRNCGYDFSLMTDNTAATRTPDLPLRDATSAMTGAAAWDDSLRRTTTPAPGELAPGNSFAPPELDAVVPVPAANASNAAGPTLDSARAAARAAASSLPLFHPGADDEPLIKLPLAPRPPLAVRRTPDKPRLRAVPKQSRRATEDVAAEFDEPGLTFADEPVLTPSARPAASAVAQRPVSPRPVPAEAEASGSLRRLTAAAIDHAILLVIDLTVVYFTLKMAALTLNDWQQLPPVPLAAFLGLVKVAYFGAFTLVGGQTIGKMATQIRVISEDGAALDAARTIQRTAVGAVSLLAAGIGFLPMLIAADRRGLHDRVARTRVVRS